MIRFYSCHYSHNDVFLTNWSIIMPFATSEGEREREKGGEMCHGMGVS